MQEQSLETRAVLGQLRCEVHPPLSLVSAWGQIEQYIGTGTFSVHKTNTLFRSENFLFFNILLISSTYKQERQKVQYDKNEIQYHFFLYATSYCLRLNELSKILLQQLHMKHNSCLESNLFFICSLYFVSCCSQLNLFCRYLPQYSHSNF